MKFNIKFPNGKSETVEQSDCSTVEQYINSRFGRNAKPDAKVTLVTGEPETSAKPEKTPKAKK